jgi:hypothetical protein
VRPAITATAAAAPAMVEEFPPYLVNQVQISRFCWRVCQISPVYPDGSEEPNPFDPGGPEAWPLTERVRHLAGYVAAYFHRLVVAVAHEKPRSEGRDSQPYGALYDATRLQRRRPIRPPDADRLESRPIRWRWTDPASRAGALFSTVAGGLIVWLLGHLRCHVFDISPECDGG